ncbi:uncharacterized protein [Pocillopora verrucosa]|uniref:uncharacterized protein n=1 Tax=Pocillopora verrucosa TaxID=203993 RepID=UPI00333E7A70
MELTSFFCIFLWSGICSGETIHAKQWFVSRYDGTFKNNCGLNTSSPCKTLQQVTVHASEGDIINIDGTGTSRDPYPCQNEKGLDLAGLVLRSYNSRAFISCRRNGFRFFCGMASRGVILEEITFVNTSIHLFECSLNVVACSFKNSSVPTLTLKYYEYSLMRNVQLNGCTFQNNSASGVTIYGNSSLDLNVLNSTFVSNKIRSEGDAILNISIQNLHANQSSIKANFTDLRVLQNICSGKACFRVFAGINGTDLVLVMERVLFESNVAEVNILDVHGFSNGYTDFKSTQFLENTGRAVKIHNGDSVDLKIETSIFSGNGIPYSRIKPEWDYDESNGGAVLVDGFTHGAMVSLHGSKFNSNKGGSGGACAFVNILRSLLVDIKNCRFVRNEGRFSGGAVAVGSFSKRLDYSDWICIHGSEFIGNKLLMDTCGDLVCGGGAVGLYVKHMGNLSIVNDTFTDNQAEGKASGAIYAEVDYLYSDVEILSSEFLRNWATKGTSTLEITFSVSSQPRVTLQNLTFISNSADVNNSFTRDVKSDIVIHPGNSYVVLRSCKIQKNSGGGISVDLTSYGQHFRGNVSFLMEDTFISENIDFAMSIEIFEQAFQPVYHLKNVSFVNNNCHGYGWGCIFLTASNNNCSFHLEQSTFLNNFGSSGVINIVPSRPGKSIAQLQTIINNTEFRNNSGDKESILTLMNVNAIEIQNCHFIDNFGGVVSSHINIESCSGSLTMWNITFNQSVESLVVYTGGGQFKDVVTFNGFLTVTQSEKVEIRNSSFILEPFSVDSKVIVAIEGVAPDILDGSVLIESPINTKLNMQRLTPEFIYRKQVTRVSVWFSTQRCPVGTYSIRRGIQSGYRVKELVNCFPCPVGGNCSSSLAAQPNFWGYPVNNDTVIFKLCPEGYCCLPSVDNKCFYDNNSYLHSGCQGNRTGILCGQCKQNFTEGLFTTECVRAKDCTRSWYLVVFLALTFLFALYLVGKPPVFEWVGKQLTWFIPRRTEENDQVICSLNSTVRESVSPNYGCLKIIFYFYQVAGVLIVPSYGVKNLLRNKIVLPFTNLFNLKPYANTNWKICPWPIFTPLSKTVFDLVTVMTIFFWIPVLYLLHSGLNKLRKRRPTFPPAGPYLGVVLEIVLLGYSVVTGTIVRLFHCVRIQKEYRWYYDAQYVCWNQWWQQAAFVVIALNLIPFILTLYFASLQLYRGKISGKIFLLACILPFPYLSFVLYDHVKEKVTKRADYQKIPLTTDTNSSTSIKASLLEVLCRPFTKPQDDQSNGRIYWESVLIGRRFLLIAIGWWQLEHALIRSVCLTIFCLAYLLHHIYCKPFAHSWVNVTEIVSLATLVVIGILNVGLAPARSDVSGISQPYLSILLTSEAVLLSFIPIVSLISLFLALLSKFVQEVIILWKATRARWFISEQKYDVQSSAQGGDEC